jgi:hypothetical protein
MEYYVEGMKRAVWEAYRVYSQQLEPQQRAYHGVPKSLLYGPVAPFGYFVQRLHKRALFVRNRKFALVTLRAALGELVTQDVMRLLTSHESAAYRCRQALYAAGSRLHSVSFGTPA